MLQRTHHSFGSTSTREQQLCQQRSGPERSEATPEVPQRPLPELRSDLRELTESQVKEYRTFLEQQEKDFSANPSQRSLDIREPIMARALWRRVGELAEQQHAACMRLTGDERTKALQEFANQMKEIEDKLKTIGFRFLYLLNDENRSFSMEGIGWHYADHFEWLMEPHRKELSTARGTVRRTSDLDGERLPGLRNFALREQADQRVGRIQEQIRTLEQARNFLVRRPRTHFEQNRFTALEHFRKTRQQPPELRVDDTPPPQQALDEMGWALSSLNVIDGGEVGSLWRETETEFLRMGVVATYNADYSIAGATVGQRRRVNAAVRENAGWVFEKTGPNRWESSQLPHTTLTDEQMQTRTAAVLNPRFRITLRRLQVREDRNEIEDEIRERDSRAEIGRQMERAGRIGGDRNTEIQGTLATMEGERTATTLRTYNESLRIPPERVLRHRLVRLAETVEEGFDNQETPVTAAVAEINTLFVALQTAGKTTEARTVLEGISARLARRGYALSEFEVGNNRQVQVRLTEATPPSVPRAERRTPQGQQRHEEGLAILRRRADMGAFRDLATALQAYLKIESRGIQDTDVRRALDASSAAGKVVEERFMAIRENAAELRIFEAQLSRILLAAGYDYTGFRKFGENDYSLTFEYRGGR